MVFVLDDNVYASVIVACQCTHHESHAVRLILDHTDTETARTFLNLASRLIVRCTDEHKHPLDRNLNG